MLSQRIAIIGAGALGTACGVLLSASGHAVSLWTRREELARELTQQRENRRLLPDVSLPESLRITADARESLADAELILLAVPSKFLVELLPVLADSVPAGVGVVSGVKGIEPETFLRPSELVTRFWRDRPIAVMGGPCHAEEFVRRKPASVVVAAREEAFARRVQDIFTNDRFRVYTNDDPLGVELAGALKNVIAVAAGICDGAGHGDNAKSALLTRAVVEMTRFGLAWGAQPATFTGLAGMGDLITTCISPYGRNRKVGERLGRGETLAAILADSAMVAEGVTTARSIDSLARRRGIDMPITRQVAAVLFENLPVTAATDALMMRPAKSERADDT